MMITCHSVRRCLTDSEVVETSLVGGPDPVFNARLLNIVTGQNIILYMHINLFLDALRSDSCDIHILLDQPAGPFTYLMTEH